MDFILLSETDNIFILLMLGTIGVFIITMAVFYFLLTTIKKNSQHKEELQKKELEYQANLFASIVSSQEQERRLIGKELHDEVSSVLYALKLRLKSDNKEENIENNQAIDKIIGITRNISHLLSPPEIELLGFHDSIKELCNGFSMNNSGITIILNDTLDGYIPKEKFQLSLMLYRIVQELITNTIKHAGATIIRIEISLSNNVFNIHYHDNGKGINAEILDKPHTMGLKNIFSRLLIIKANYQIKSVNGFDFNLFLDPKYI